MAAPQEYVNTDSTRKIITTLPFNACYEQALVCLSNRDILDVSKGRPFLRKMANDRCFLSLWWPKFM